MYVCAGALPGQESRDPTVEVFAASSGEGAATATGVAVDADSNVVVSGDFSGHLDLSGDGQPDVHSHGSLDLLLAKFDRTGRLMWVKTAGGPGKERGYKVALGSDGSAYWTGSYEHEVDFDGDGSLDLRSRGRSDVFVAKHDRDGGLLWARSAGGPGVDYAQDIEVDVEGSAYIAGDFRDHADFNDDGVADVTGVGGQEAFVAKWSTNGDWSWTAAGVGPGSDRGVGVAVDDEVGVYLTGWIQGEADFGRNTVLEAEHGGFDSGLDSSIDSEGNVYVAGEARGKTSVDFGMFLAAYDLDGDLRWARTLSLDAPRSRGEVGDGDAMLSKFDKNGRQQWVRVVGGSDTDLFRHVSVSTHEVVVGGVGSPAFSWGADAEPEVAGPSIVVASFDTSGRLQWSSFVNSAIAQGAAVRCVAVEADGGILAVGYNDGALRLGAKEILPEDTANEGQLFVLRFRR